MLYIDAVSIYLLVIAIYCKCVAKVLFKIFYDLHLVGK